MPLGKQAKMLSRGQVDAALGYLTKTRHPIRNRAIFLASTKAGLRAKEIAHLRWEMITDAEGEIDRAIRLEDRASKGRSGRVIPLNEELRFALTAWQQISDAGSSDFVFHSERKRRMSPQVIVNLFSRWYEELGFNGCSSHSGRRTFITNAARKISTVGGSLRDVQVLAGHTSLRTTQRYIDVDEQAQKRVVQLS